MSFRITKENIESFGLVAHSNYYQDKDKRKIVNTLFYTGGKMNDKIKYWLTKVKW